MAGKPASPFGAAVRELILSEQKTGNPTWKTIGDKVKKIAQENKDKRNDKDLSIAFNQIKQQLKKKSGASSAPKKRGRPPKAASVAANGAVKKTKANGHPVSIGSFELAIKFAQEAGGLDAAISTLHQLKAIKESI